MHDDAVYFDEGDADFAFGDIFFVVGGDVDS